MSPFERIATMEGTRPVLDWSGPLSVADDHGRAMPRYTVDLHNHTPLIPNDYHDAAGTTPRAIVHTALEHGIDVLGIADHFSVAYGRLLHRAAREVADSTGSELQIVSGAELKVRWGADETHLIALFDPLEAEGAFDALLVLLGMKNPAAAIHDLPCVVLAHDPREVARHVNELGGLCHIGHIDRVFGEYRLLDSPIAEELLADDAFSAVEIIEPGCLEVCGLNSALPQISSSDAHGLHEIGRRTATLEMSECTFAGLRDGLVAARR